MDRKKSLTFADAVRKSRPAAFSSMLKPIGSRCNLDCAYCYYLDKVDIYAGEQSTMGEELLEEYTRQYIEANGVDEVTFNWHGGEPLLAGKEYYRKALALQKKYANGKRISNVLQTNGTLIDREWCELFRENDFLIGISIDGPQEIHDAFRRTKGGTPTFDKVVAAVEMMRREGVEYNTLSTVNSLSEGRGREVYRFLKSLGSHYMQFLPVLEYVKPGAVTGRPVIVPPGTEGSGLAEWSVSARGYGAFMCDIFDEWVIGDVGDYFVQLFDVSLAQWLGVPPALCSFGETCGEALVVEHNGDVYSCDHFVYPEYRIGNIREKTLTEMIASRSQFRFGIDKRNTLPRTCLRCKYYFACRGECPKHRFDTSPDGESGLNALCEGYSSFFAHVDPYMKYMAELLKQGQPAAFVIPWARQRMGIG